MASVKVLMVMEGVLLLALSPDLFLRVTLIIIQDHKRPIRKGAYDHQSISAPPRRKGSWRRSYSLLRAHRVINLFECNRAGERLTALRVCWCLVGGQLRACETWEVQKIK